MKTIPLVVFAILVLPSLALAGRIYGSIRMAGNPVPKGTRVEITALVQDTTLASAQDTTLAPAQDTVLASGRTNRSGSYHLYVKQKGKYRLKVYYPECRDPKKAHTASIEVYSYEKASSRYDLILYEDDDGKYQIRRR